MKLSRIAMLSLMLMLAMLTAACGADSTATTAPQPTATTAPVEATTAPTMAATMAPTMAAATEAPTMAATMAPTMAAATEAPTMAATMAAATPTMAAAATMAPETPVANVPAATIRVGSYESGAALDIWNGLITNFNKIYPQIKISFEPVPDNYGTKLLTQIAANDAPDVFQVGDGDVRMFVERGGAADLTDYIAGTKDGMPGVDASSYYPTLLQTGQVDGKSYFFTKDYSPLAIYYNKALFDKAGVAYPKDGWTWQDFQDAAVKLTSGSGATAQYGVSLPGDWTRAVETFVFQNGGDITSPDGTKATGYLDSDATVQAIQYYVDLYNKYKVSPSPAEVSTSFNGVDLFATGRAAMSFTGIWPEAGYATTPNFNFGTVGLPQGKVRANAICWSGLGLYKGSKNPDQAWLFLRYIGGQAGQTAFAANGLPSMPAVADNLKITADPAKSTFLNENQYLKPLPDMRSRYWNDTANKYFGKALDNLLAGTSTDVKAELSSAASQADADYATLAAQQ